MATLTETLTMLELSDSDYPIAHLETQPGSGLARCGKQLHGEPAPRETEHCIVCADLAR